MDLRVRKDVRNNGAFYHKVPKGTCSTVAKRTAILDISEFVKECDSFYSKNYVIREYEVLRLSEYFPETINIDNLK